MNVMHQIAWSQLSILLAGVMAAAAVNAETIVGEPDAYLDYIEANGSQYIGQRRDGAEGAVGHCLGRRSCCRWWERRRLWRRLVHVGCTVWKHPFLSLLHEP